MHNLSGRITGRQFDVDMMIHELEKYNSDDGIFMRRFAEENLDITLSVDTYLRLYNAM